MKVAFRTDASLQIGTGHVMRCLALADALAGQGSECLFICRAFEGHLIDFIRSKGHATHALPAVTAEPDVSTVSDGLVHSQWLGTTQAQDVAACTSILAAGVPDWLIFDHYALDCHSEAALRPYCRKLMVIDDLADRYHACDLLLDQTFGREEEDYHSLVPEHCQLLCGSAYALLRPEFAALRSNSLQRRTHPALRQLLITMGGVDKDNATGQVLQALRDCPLPQDCQITIALGPTAPWLESVHNQAQGMPWSTSVLVGVRDMAQLMADSDLAIGGAGATSWERCCLGVPTIMLVLAKNQEKVARGLEKAGAARLVRLNPDMPKQLKDIFAIFSHDLSSLLKMSDSAAHIVTGQGIALTLQAIGRLN